MKKNIFFLVLVLFLAVSCGETVGEMPENKGLAGFLVEFAGDFDPGTPEKRIENNGEDIIAAVNITALGYDKQPINDYSGEVEVSLLYGSNADVARLQLKNGKAENVSVKMRYCLGKDRVVVNEVVKNEGETVYSETGKLGVSPEFYPSVATISAIQGNVKGTKGNPSVYNNRNLTISGREMVVIAVIEGGFYLSEVGTEDYSSIYMYTYSTPYVDDNGEDESMSLPVGVLIESANGSVFEFFGFTEMSFPTFKPVYVEKNGKRVIKVDTSLIPDPIDISDMLDDNDEMEKKEASLVTVKNVTVAWFNENDNSFIEFTQFPLKTSGERYVMAQTLYTAPLFNAVEEKPSDGKTIHHFNFTGILKQHTSARPSTWIIVPRDMGDIECLDCE